MPESLADIEKTAMKWFKAQVKKGQIVFLKSSLDPATYNFLTQKSLMASLNKQYAFVKTEFELAEQVFQANLWIIVFQFLNLSFEDGWYFTGKYSYKLNLDDFAVYSKQITISTKSKSNRMIKLLDGYEILASYDKDFDEKPIVKKKFFKADYFLPRAEYLMIQASANDYKEHNDELVSFMRSSERDEAYIVKYFENNSNPVLLARLIGALRQIEDFTLRVDLEEVLKLSGQKVTIPNPFDDFNKLHTIERPAYLNRFQISMDKAIKTLSKMKFPKRLSKQIDAKDLDNLVINDAYHSLTIEGYTVTKALLVYLHEHEEEESNSFPSDLRDDMAAKGFMNVITYIKTILKTGYTVSEALAYRLYVELWKPSIGANLIDPQDIYRKHMVTIKGAMHVPPGHEKVPYLMQEFYSRLPEIDNGFALAIFTHFFYVGIHPHSDGNGRISRFMMNLSLIRDKYRWLTIPSYQRKEYFGALEKSQVEDDISYFANYILNTYKERPEL